jgi:anti-sigma28 factor (negative regulator of flagellin synthesis)
MIISRAEIESAVAAYRTSTKRKSRIGAVAYDADRTEISEGSTALASFFSEVLAEPFYRTSLVNELQHRISEGRYYVPTDEIVEKMIGRLVAEALPA